VAAQFGVPVGTISARVSRARDRLMAVLSAARADLRSWRRRRSPALRHGLAGVPPALLGRHPQAGRSGFAFASQAILHLAVQLQEARRLTGKLLSAALVAAALFTAAGACGTRARSRKRARRPGRRDNPSQGAP